MNDSLRDLLTRGADTVGRPSLDVADLVAQAQQRLVRRRLGVVAASAAAVAVIAVGGLALRPDDGSRSPNPPPEPAQTSKTPDTKPAPEPAIYFDALAVDGDALTDAIYNISGAKDIYLTRPGGQTRQLIASDANEHCPRVSPDGDFLAYLEGPRLVVRRLGPDGDLGATTARFSYPSVRADELTCPQWSPVGRQIAIAVAGFDLDAYEQSFAVRVIDVDGTDRVVATRQSQYMPLAEIAWSPDGDAIAYTTPDSVWVAPIDGGEPSMRWQGRTPSYGAPAGFPPHPGRPVRLSWLPTGELAVSAQTDVDGVDELHLVDPVSGRDRVLDTFWSESALTWSPDGSRLVFWDRDGARVLDRTSGTTAPVRPRLRGRELPVWTLTWSPDGRRLVGTAGNPAPSGDGFALVSMAPDGSSVEVLTPWVMALYSDADPSWSPR